MNIMVKEVADVTFYNIGSNGRPTNPVLFLDTLKVSTIEQTGDTAEARGGKGNAPLISWDFGKEINVTLEDALFSAKSLAIMFGNGSVAELAGYSDSAASGSEKLIMKTITFNGSVAPTQYEDPRNGVKRTIRNPKYYTEAGATVEPTALTSDGKYFCTFDVVVDEAVVIEISANSFPGTYYITGDTFARSETTGKDEFFQFIIPKAKVQSENTITLEAEGDPSVFNMNLKVLRPTNGKMMQLVKYDIDTSNDSIASASEVSVEHNHVLNVNNESVG